MVSRKDYDAEAVAAAQSVLVEISHLLGEYRENIVLVGGWVPKFSWENPDSPHVGSTDIDLALDHRRFKDEGYRTVKQLLREKGYTEGKQPFIFFRQVGDLRVEVDLLAGEYEGTGRGHRTQRVQDAKPRKARGCDLAFEASHRVTVEAELPDGGLDTVEVRVASIVPFLIMKAMALENRLKEKDSYDIYYSLANHPGGIPRIVDEFHPYMDHGLTQEGLTTIAAQFDSPESVGPVSVANFDEISDPEERELLQRDAYERVTALIQGLELP